MYLYKQPAPLDASLRLSSPTYVSQAPPTRLEDESPRGYAFVLSDHGGRHEQRHQYDDPVDMLQLPPRRKTLTRGHHRPHGALDDANAGRVLGTLSVVAITFFFGCGGPLGSESLVAIGGPVLALVAIIVYPIVFTFPYGAVVAELCTAFPEDGGFPIAVRNAFGQFWGVQVGYWSWVGNIMSTAIYPAILMDLLSSHASLDIASPVTKYVVKAALALLLSVPSFLGTKLVSRTMILFLVTVLTAVLMYVVWAYAKSGSYDEMGMIRRTNMTYDATEGVVTSSGDVDVKWLDLLNTLFWNFDGIQMASVFGGQVLIPARVYPRAISITIALTVLVYLLPLPATIANKFIDWTIFDDGSYGEVAVTIGGNFLRGLMILVNFATTIGMFVSSTFCEATEIAGMAQSGIIHASLGRRNARFASPHNSIALTLVLTLILMALDTDFLIPVTNAFACLVAVVIFATGVQLRRKFPHFPRPSTVPGGPGVLLAIAVVPFAICATIIGVTITDSVSQLLTVVGFVALGLIYSAVEHWRGGADVNVVRF